MNINFLRRCFPLSCNASKQSFFKNSMKKKGRHTEPLPTELLIEIFSRLPVKSVCRFHCVSKQWRSILPSRARLLFAVERKGSLSFFSVPQPSSFSPIVQAKFHTRFSEDVSRFRTLSYASGLFYFMSLWDPEIGRQSLVANPITGQYVKLPEVDMYRNSIGFIGFDPIGEKFKVLAEGYTFCPERDHHEVITLGTGVLRSRPKGKYTADYDKTVCEGVCINGVLYYLVEHCNIVSVRATYSIVCFDVRSEKFKSIAIDGFSNQSTTRLVNVKGKLGWIKWDYGKVHGKYTLKLSMSVLENVERLFLKKKRRKGKRPVWSEYEYTLPNNKLMGDTSKVSVAGVSATGEIVVTMDYTCKPYYVFYFNPEKNTLKSVEIQGFGAFEAVEFRGEVTAFVDHVEHQNVDDIVRLKSTGVYANKVKHCSKCEEEEEKKENQCE